MREMADSKKIEDGGLAFPLSVTEDSFDYLGMSLRDWFAGRAMQAQLTGFWHSEQHHGWSDTEIAAEAYRIADAMIAARKAGA